MEELGHYVCPACGETIDECRDLVGGQHAVDPTPRLCRASVDVVADYLTIRADFGLRFPFHLGALANTFGKDSFAFGLDTTVTFEGRIDAGFTYALRFVWEYYTMRFSGPTDNVPAMAEGGRGKDHGINLQLLVGWSL